MSGAMARRLGRLSPRAELTLLLLLGAAGAGIVFLALRQGWAQVRTDVPAPLPDSVIRISGQSLVPLAGALDIAALASLAAVLATRRLARRVTGGLLAVAGAAIAAAVGSGVSRAAVLAAAAQGLGPAGGAGAGTAPGSVTGGGVTGGGVTGGGAAGGGTAVPGVGGFHSRVVLTAASWQAVAVAGTLLLIAAGLAVAWRAARLPEMSSRYDSPAGAAGPVSPAGGDPAANSAAANSAAASDTAASPAESAAMWESLSRGEDPTSARYQA